MLSDRLRYLTAVNAKRKGLDPLVEKLPAWVLNRTTVRYIIELFLRENLFSSGKPIILLALPKSGGSWLSNVLADSNGFIKVKKSTIKNCQVEQNSPWNSLHPYFTDMTELETDVFKMYENRQVILHAHLAPTGNNIEILKSFDCNIIYLNRNIVDVVVSLYYHLLNRDYEISRKLKTDSKESGLDRVIEVFSPSFIRFDKEWNNALTSITNCRKLSYETLIEKEYLAIWKILTELGYHVSQIWLKKVYERFRAPSKDDKIEDDNLSLALKYRVKKHKNQSNELTPDQISQIFEIRDNI